MLTADLNLTAGLELGKVYPRAVGVNMNTVAAGVLQNRATFSTDSYDSAELFNANLFVLSALTQTLNARRTLQKVERIRGSLMPFEVLHFAFVLFCFFQTAEGAKIAPLARRRIQLARVQTIFAGLQFADHAYRDAAQRSNVASACPLKSRVIDGANLMNS
jgi:hypothetical protein